MKLAIEEINRRREYQLAYNREHDITPQTIYKPIREKIIDAPEPTQLQDQQGITYNESVLTRINPESLTDIDKKRMVKKLEREMKKQADQMNFELAIAIRDKIKELKG